MVLRGRLCSSTTYTGHRRTPVTPLKKAEANVLENTTPTAMLLYDLETLF